MNLICDHMKECLDRRRATETEEPCQCGHAKSHEEDGLPVSTSVKCGFLGVMVRCRDREVTGEERFILAVFGYRDTRPLLSVDGHEKVHQLLRLLSRYRDGRVVHVLKWRYGIGCEGHTYKDIGAKLGVTGQRANQIVQKGLRVARWHIYRDPEYWMSVREELSAKYRRIRGE